MITFKTFLEAKVKAYEVSELNNGDLILAIEKNCSQAIAAIKSGRVGGTIWRGTKRFLKSGIYDPGSGERKSENTANFYTKFVDENPANSKWPKRSKSFICSTDKSTASGYAGGRDGNLSLVLPFNNSKIGIVGTNDFWDLTISCKIQYNDKELTFKTDIVLLNDVFARFFDNSNGISFSSAISLLKSEPLRFYKELEDDYRIFYRLSFGNRVDKEFGTDVEKSDDFRKSFVSQMANNLQNIYDLQKLGCSLISIDNFHVVDEEVWFQDKCILVSAHDIEKVVGHFSLWEQFKL